jgi:uncharacterized membrane protein YhaH (DUF805 family)
MIADYFGDVFAGRLSAKRFLIRWAVLVLTFLVAAIGLGALIGITERLIGGDIAEVQRSLAENFGGPAAIILLISFFAFAFAMLNIIAKRARDVGLPGWLTALVIAGLSGAATQATGQSTSGGLGLLLTLILAFLPTDWLAKRD